MINQGRPTRSYEEIIKKGGEKEEEEEERKKESFKQRGADLIHQRNFTVQRKIEKKNEKKKIEREKIYIYNSTIK